METVVLPELASILLVKGRRKRKEHPSYFSQKTQVLVLVPRLLITSLGRSISRVDYRLEGLSRLYSLNYYVVILVVGSTSVAKLSADLHHFSVNHTSWFNK